VIEDLLSDRNFTLFRRIDGTAIEGNTDNIMTARLGPEEFDLGLLFIRTNADVLQPEEMMPVRGGNSYPYLGEDLCWYGHPASLGTDPVFSRGTLACYRTDSIANHYLVNGSAYPGMSGGAVADKKGHVVGLVSKWWADENLENAQGMLRVAPSVMIRQTIEKRLGATVLDTLPDHQS
jgi:hypothetical protein